MLYTIFVWTIVFRSIVPSCAEHKCIKSDSDCGLMIDDIHADMPCFLSSTYATCPTEECSKAGGIILVLFGYISFALVICCVRGCLKKENGTDPLNYTLMADSKTI